MSMLTKENAVIFSYQYKLWVPSEASKGGLKKKGNEARTATDALIRRTNSSTPPG